MDNQKMCRLEDKISELLWQRWMACYLVHDTNIRHASNAFDNGEWDRWKKARVILEQDSRGDSGTDAELKHAYNQILSAEIENMIQEYMKNCKKPRTVIELYAARAIAEFLPQNIIT